MAATVCDYCVIKANYRAVPVRFPQEWIVEPRVPDPLSGEESCLRGEDVPPKSRRRGLEPNGYEEGAQGAACGYFDAREGATGSGRVLLSGPSSWPTTPEYIYTQKEMAAPPPSFDVCSDKALSTRALRMGVRCLSIFASEDTAGGTEFVQSNLLFVSVLISDTKFLLLPSNGLP
ncbi:hypothetical protein KM043_016185 [Ampulex compressa]|nr:hypothetical protein KM043_016185 [Ampulex compressa]